MTSQTSCGANLADQNWNDADLRPRSVFRQTVRDSLLHRRRRFRVTAAQRLQKSDSETAAERKELTDRMALLDDAEERVRRAEALSGRGTTNLSPEEMKQREAEARRELDVHPVVHAGLD